MMDSGMLRALALIVFFCPAPAALAQVELLPVDRAGESVILLPEGPFGRGGPGLFANTPLSADGRLRAAGTVGGNNINQAGRHNVRFGFDYLRPYWTFRDFALAVPANRAGGFPLLGDTGRVDNHFAFAPRVNYEYDFADAPDSLLGDIGVDTVGASGTFLSLSGRLQRKIASAGGGFGELNANSNLTLVLANLVEVGRWVRYADLMLDRKHYEPWEALEDLEIELRIGSRYASIDQNYTGSLTSGVGQANVSTRYSSQSFRGFGLTTAANLVLPKHHDWLLFANTRFSVLIGDNRKDSTLTVTTVGRPAIAESISQSRSALLPMTEFELGVEWGQGLADWFRTRGVLNKPFGLDDPLHPRLTVRGAFTAQFWGDVGPLSAGSTQAYRTSDLFLLGAHVMVGLHR